MQQYHDLMRHCRDNGVEKDDRTGTGTYSIFGYQMRFNLSDGFPLVTTKQCHLKSIIHELLWFLMGETDIAYLKENGVSIWDEWVKPGTEVWGDLLTFEERQRQFDKLVERKAISAKAVEDYKERLCQDLNLRELTQDDLCTMWDFFKVPDRKLIGGKLGPVYGKQWRDIEDLRVIPQYDLDSYLKRGYMFKGDLLNAEDNANYDYVVVERKIDQFAEVIHRLITNPDDRGIIVNAWHVPSLKEMALRPCHNTFQFNTRRRPWMDVMSDLSNEDLLEEFDLMTVDMRDNEQKEPDWTVAKAAPGLHPVGWRHPDYYKFLYEFAEKNGIKTRYLDCQLYQRSADIFIGVPFNIASYALLTMMVAQCVDMLPGDFVHTLGDAHIYKNHLEQVDLQLSREPYKLPQMVINQDVKDIFAFKFEDFELRNYKYHPHIAAPVAV